MRVYLGMVDAGKPGADWLWDRMPDHAERMAFDGPHPLTYGDLLELTAAVARRLRERIPQGGAVLVLAPRAVPDATVLLLALWRCALTPILGDVRTSPARVDEVLCALPPAAVLRPAHADEHDADAFAATGALRWSLELRDRPGGFPYGCPDPAYVVPTSGSTGVPKLVLCRHDGLRRMADALIARYDYTAESRVLQFAPASYDAMIAEVAVPLAAGATLVFDDFGEPPSPVRLSEALVEQRVTHATLPPTLLRRLTGLSAPQCTIVSAGEALDGALAGRLLERCGRLINAYGPCEATVAATAFDVTAPTETIPIGTALPGVEVELVAPPSSFGASEDARLIAIAGPTVAWGYVSGDRLAAPATPGFSSDGRFVTGDLAWRTETGDLAFAGRIDRQMKRWGHRIELGAIERRIAALPAVAECAVVPEPGGLHAFLVSAAPTRDVVTAARGVLADYEQPTHWHAVDELPVLANDKLDVRALVGAFADRDTPSRPEVDPRVTAVWEEFVGAADDPQADVFALGGDSMAVVMLLAAVADRFEVTIDIADFLRRPTLAGLEAELATNVPPADPAASQP